jgi:hypothetical protein
MGYLGVQERLLSAENCCTAYATPQNVLQAKLAPDTSVTRTDCRDS